MEALPKEVQNYRTKDGREPFAEWLDSLRDIRAIDKIEKRLKQVQSGTLGTYRSVGEGVCEFKIKYGPGYRIYFGQIGSVIILILCGGDKSSQQEDIKQAKEYWSEYGKRKSTDQ